MRPIPLGDIGDEYTSRIQHRVVEGRGAPGMDGGSDGVAEVALPDGEAQPCSHRGYYARRKGHAGEHVLDLASGTGDPALSLALAVGPDGSVTATDLVPEMLAAATDHAQQRHITNLTFQQADPENLSVRSPEL